MLLHPVDLDDDADLDNKSHSLLAFGDPSLGQNSRDIEDSNLSSKNDVQDMKLDIYQLELSERAEENQNLLISDKLEQSRLKSEH